MFSLGSGVERAASKHPCSIYVSRLIQVVSNLTFIINEQMAGLAEIFDQHQRFNLGNLVTEVRDQKTDESFWVRGRVVLGLRKCSKICFSKLFASATAGD